MINPKNRDPRNHVAPLTTRATTSIGKDALFDHSCTISIDAGTRMLTAVIPAALEVTIIWAPDRRASSSCVAWLSFPATCNCTQERIWMDPKTRNPTRSHHLAKNSHI